MTNKLNLMSAMWCCLDTRTAQLAMQIVSLCFLLSLTKNVSNGEQYHKVRRIRARLWAEAFRSNQHVRACKSPLQASRWTAALRVLKTSMLFCLSSVKGPLALPTVCRAVHPPPSACQ